MNSPIGLVNVRNDCFFNSVVQALFSLQSFRNHVGNFDCQIPAEIFSVCSIQQLFREIEIRSDNPIQTHQHLMSLGLPDYVEHSQYDAQECLTYMINLFYPRINDKSSVHHNEVPDSCEFSLDGEQSIICHNCKKHSNMYFRESLSQISFKKFEKESSIQLKIEEMTNDPYGEALNAPYQCENCKLTFPRGTSATKASTLMHINKYIIIQLKIFGYDEITGHSYKTIPFLQIEEEIDNILLGKLNLRAVIYHIGDSLIQGHYASSVKYDNIWYTCNDSICTNGVQLYCDPFDDEKKFPYLLIYEKDEGATIQSDDSNIFQNSLPDLADMNSPIGLVNVRNDCFFNSVQSDESNIFQNSLPDLANMNSPIGLVNVRNDCFFNSVVQALFSLQSFRNHVGNFDCQIPAEIFSVCSIQQLFREIEIRSDNPIQTHQHLMSLGLPDYVEHSQYDAQECLTYILNLFYPRINDKSSLHHNEVPDNCEFLLDGEQSIVCHNCKKHSNTYFRECLSQISFKKFEIESSIQSKIEEMTNDPYGEALNAPYQCKNCKLTFPRGTSATQSRTLMHINKYIIIQLKIFGYDEITSQSYKTIPFLQIEEEIDNILLGKLNLCAVIYHIGDSLIQGHYASSVKYDNIWYTCNDSICTKGVQLYCDPFDDEKKFPYLLIYEKDGAPVQSDESNKFQNSSSDLANVNSPIGLVNVRNDCFFNSLQSDESNIFQNSLPNLANVNSPIGLVNVRNDCFFNSVVQALFSLQSFRHHVGNFDCQIPAEIFSVCSIQQLFREIEIRSDNPIQTHQHLMSLGLPDYVEHSQYDAQECLTYILNLFYPRINDKSSLHHNEVPDNCEFLLDGEQSIICHNCKKHSSMFFREFLSQISFKKFEIESSIQSKIEEMTNDPYGEALNAPYKCENCKLTFPRGTSATQSRTLMHINKYIIIQLKIFGYDEITGHSYKTIPFLQIEEEIDNILLGKLNLRAVIYHIGDSLIQGHYASSVKYDNIWYTCNDSICTNGVQLYCDPFDDAKKFPYLLIYEKDGAPVQCDESNIFQGENNLYTVVLYDTRNSPEVNIAQWLIQKNHAKSEDKVSSNTERIQGRWPFNKTTEEVYVTSVINPGKFWIQLTKYSDKLDAMMDEIDKIYSPLGAGDLSVVHPIIGQYCCSKFTEDEGWYRAVIEEVHGKDINVRYIDYGNSEKVTTDSIKVLVEKFMDIPTFAIPCRLSALEAYPSWDQSVNTILLDKTFTANFLTNESTCEVELLAGGKSVSDQIKTASGMQPSAASAMIEECKLKVDSFVKLTLLHASSPHDFYCQLVASQEDLLKMESEISVHVSQQTAERFEGGVGSYCLAKSSELNKWCRAEVFDVANRKFSVQFVDYGNEETLDRNSLRALPLIFTTLQKQAALCSLTYIKPRGAEWTNGAIELLQSEWSNKIITLEIEAEMDGKYDVRPLKEGTGNENDLARKLIQSGLARSSNPPSICSTRSTSSSSSKRVHAYSEPEVSEKEMAYVTFVHSALLISIQLQKYEESINKVMETLAAICPSSNMVHNPTVGSVCGALFPADNAWYRAEVTGIVDSKHAKVLFVDYGNEETIEVDFLRQLSPDVFSTPKTCVKCSLHDVYDTDIDLVASKKWLEENLVNQLVNVEFCGTTSDLVRSAKIYFEEDNTINDQLYYNFELEAGGENEVVESSAASVEVSSAPTAAAEVSSDLKYTQPELSSVEGGYCTFVSSPTCICIQLNKYEKDLATMMDKLSAHCANAEAMTSVVAGSICAALYSEDEGWYRAEVTNVEGNNATVYFVDYGNTEIVPMANLRKLTAELVKLPRACFLCQLTDVHLEDLDVAGIEPWLQTNVVDQAVNVTDIISNDGVNEGYVFANGSESNINDMLYENFALEEGVEQVEATAADVPVETEPPVAPVANESAPTDPTPTAAVEVSSAPTVAAEVSSDLKYMQPELSSVEGGYCTFVSSPTCLCIQLNKYENDLAAMMDKLSAHCANAEAMTNVVVGSICAALYSEDEGWYRAEVTNVEGSNATVYFVDYGNTEIVLMANLRKLTAELVKLPRACFLCQFTDVYLEDLDVAGIEPWLQANVVDQAVNVTDLISKDGSHEGYVFANGSESNINDLLYENFALEEGVEQVEEPAADVPVETEPPVAPVKAENSVAEESAPTDPTPTAAVEVSSDLKYTQPELSSVEGGYCTFVSSPTCICIQLNKYEKDLAAMMDKLSAHCANAEAMTSVAVGSICAALYSEDEGWYRAEVTNVEGSNATVYFVDYGNTEIVPMANLRKLTAELVKLPRACFLCQLTDVHLEDLDVAGIEPWLQANVVDQAVNVTDLISKDGSHEGYVFANGSESNINDLLYENFALEEGVEQVEVTAVDVPVETEPPVEADVTPTPATEVEAIPEQAAVPTTEVKISPPELALNSSYNATCFVIESAVTSKCQLSIYIDQLNELMEKIAAVAESAPVLESPSSDQICLAKYSVDEEWYRGKILDDGSVEFIDYGNGEMVVADNIRVIAPEFAVLPQTCVLVLLHDVHPKDIDAVKTKTWLEESVIEQEVKLEVMAMTTPTFIEAYVYIGESEGHINDQVYEYFALEEGVVEETAAVETPAIESVVAEPEVVVENSETPPVESVVEEQEVTPVVESPPALTVTAATQISSPELKESTIYPATCYVADSAVSLRCQLNSFGEQLDELMGKIADMAESASVLENPTPGQLCLAKSSLDEGWYRGRVLEDQNIEFIDYGNSEKVSTENIRVIAPDFTELPQTCVSAILHDVHVEDIDIEKAKSWLEENLLEQVVNLEVMSNIDSFSVEAYVHYSENNVNVNDLLYELFPLVVEESASDPVIVENVVVALAEDVSEAASAVADDDAASVSSKTSSVSSKTSAISSQASTIKADSEYVLVDNIDLPPPDITAGNTYNATCFVTESAVSVKCQLASYLEQLDELMVRIAEVAEQAEVLADPKVGQLCLAKFSLDEAWYRGKILEDGSVEFIDYGNGEKVAPADIRVISPQFVSLPQTCLSVKLHDVHTPDIDIDQTKTWLDENLLEKEVKLEIVSISDPCSVEAYIFLAGSESHVNDQIYEYFALGEAAEEVAELVNALAEATVEDEEENLDCTDLVVPSLELCANTSYQAICYDVISSTQLTFQLLTYQDKLKELMKQMTISANKARVIKKPVDGMICMAKQNQKEGWYRARIIEDGTKIQYLDYGNIESMPQELRQLLPEFILLPQSSVTMTLHDVHEEDIHVKASKYWLKENLLEKEVKLEVIDVTDTNNATAYVYQKDNESHINDHIYEQFSLEDGELEDPVGSAVTAALNSTEVAPSDESEVVVNGSVNVSSFSCETFSMPLLTVGGKEDVVFTVADNALALKCQLVKYREKLERLMKIISDEVENQPGVRFLDKGDACLAQWEDLTWYRARVLSTSESTVRVEFVDYGNEDDIITEDLRVIKPEILADQVFCMTCQLKDVNITEENGDEILEYLSRTLVDEAPVVSVLVNDVDYENEIVTVTIYQDGVNINDYLQTTYGTPGGVYRYREITLSEKINVVPSKATSLAEFSCQYADSSEELTSLMKNMAGFYKKEKNRKCLESLEVGKPCCVLRESNLTLYRGLITQNEPKVQVQFVDYGFTEEVDSQNIFKLDKPFIILTVQAFKCRLFNLLPEKDFIAWSGEAVGYFNELCLGKTLVATVINDTDGLYSVALAFENGDTVYEMLTKKIPNK